MTGFLPCCRRVGGCDGDLPAEGASVHATQKRAWQIFSAGSGWETRGCSIQGGRVPRGVFSLCLAHAVIMRIEHASSTDDHDGIGSDGWPASHAPWHDARPERAVVRLSVLPTLPRGRRSADAAQPARPHHPTNYTRPLLVVTNMRKTLDWEDEVCAWRHAGPGEHPFSRGVFASTISRIRCQGQSEN